MPIYFNAEITAHNRHRLCVTQIVQKIFILFIFMVIKLKKQRASVQGFLLLFFNSSVHIHVQYSLDKSSQYIQYDNPLPERWINAGT